jgi:hypothetical protein
MWKLVKAEIKYARPWAVGFAIFSLVLYFAFMIEAYISAALYQFTISARHYLIAAMKCSVILLPVLFYILNLVIFYSFMKEIRIRLLTVLPITLISQSLSRLLLPLLLSLLCIAITILFQSQYIIYNTHFKLATEIVTYPRLFYIIFLFTFWISLPWLISESWGRIFLIAVGIFLTIHGWIIPLFKESLAWMIGDYIYAGFIGEGPIRTATYGILDLLFIIIIFGSCITRRSFLK